MISKVHQMLLIVVLSMSKVLPCLAVAEAGMKSLRSLVTALPAIPWEVSIPALDPDSQRSSRMLTTRNKEEAPITGIFFTTSAACPEGYSRIAKDASLNGDLNEGAGGADIFFCMSRNPDHLPVTGLLFQQSSICDGNSGWQAAPFQGINGDLNQGAGGKDIFCCFSTDIKRRDSIVKMKLTPFWGGYPDYAEFGPGLNGDLNQDTGGRNIIVATYRQENNSPITGIYFVGNSKTAFINCPSGYRRTVKSNSLNGDLNESAGGAFLFFCISHDPDNEPITGLAFQTESDCDNPWESVPYQGMNGDLNQGASGADIYSCFSRAAPYPEEPALGPPIYKMQLTTSDNLGEQPRLSEGLNGDLNEGAGGKDIFIALFRVLLSEAPSLAPTIFPSSMPSISTRAICLERTLETLEAIEDSYDDSDATTTTLTLDGQNILIDDFSTNAPNNDVYRKACEEGNFDGPTGRYVELSYKAKCDSTTGESVKLVVGGQPRCYSVECNTDSDERGLFEDFTLKLTEERADLTMNEGTWKCQGAIMEHGVGSACEYETLLLSDSVEITKHMYAITPTVSTMKTLGIFEKKEKKVEFAGGSNMLRTLCKESGGMFVQRNAANVICKDPKDATGHSDKPFKVEGFFACLGASCGAVHDQTEKDKALVANFKQQMLNANELGGGEGLTCAISGTVMLSSLKVVIAASLLVVSCHLL